MVAYFWVEKKGAKEKEPAQPPPHLFLPRSAYLSISVLLFILCVYVTRLAGIELPVCFMVKPLILEHTKMAGCI